MAGRTRRRERRGRPPDEHRLHGRRGAPGGQPRGARAAGHDVGVGIDPAALRRGRLERVEVARRDARARGPRGSPPPPAAPPRPARRRATPGEHRRLPLGPLRMADGRPVEVGLRVGQAQKHGRPSLDRARLTTVTSSPRKLSQTLRAGQGRALVFRVETFIIDRRSPFFERYERRPAGVANAHETTASPRSQSPMYRFSRALFMELRDMVDPHPDTVTPVEARRRLLLACEATVERLARDPRYFARPTRTLFEEIRHLFPIPMQARVYYAIDHTLGLAKEFIREEMERTSAANTPAARPRARARRASAPRCPAVSTARRMRTSRSACRSLPPPDGSRGPGGRAPRARSPVGDAQPAGRGRLPRAGGAARRRIGRPALRRPAVLHARRAPRRRRRRGRLRRSLA